MKKKDEKSASLIRMVLAGVMMLPILALCGCGMSVTALTEEENYEVARYVADKLLQYDRSYGTGEELVYISPDLATEAPEATEEPAATAEPNVTAAPGTSNAPGGSDGTEDDGVNQTVLSDWSEFFTTDEWTITYSSYDTCQSYPKQSDVYQVQAAKGNKLLVISFDVVNNTDHNINVDLTESGLNYKLYINEDEYQPMVALLDNGGLMFLNIDMKPQEQDEAVLIFEVPEGADLSAMRLDVSK